MERTIADSIGPDGTCPIGTPVVHQAGPLSLIMNPAFLNLTLFSRPWQAPAMRPPRDAGLSP